jgi:N6-adenosine-specific RNA methylase IME4
MNGFVWNKLTKHGLPFFGMGYYTRAGSESCIIATKGSPNIINHGVRAVYNCPVGVDFFENFTLVGSYRVGEHSVKPAAFRRACLRLMGNVPRLEMFARKSIPGWDVFGNEVDDSIKIGSKK